MPHARSRSQRRERRLFQSRTLTALFGPSIATMVTRIIVVLAAVGTLAIITVGLLNPNTPPAPTSKTTQSSSGTQVGLQVGDAAPNFTLTTPDGKKKSLSDYRGKPVMLNFWFATCPGCLAEIPGMQRFYAAQHTAGKDFVILGVNTTDDASTTSQFVQQYGLTYPVVLDSNNNVTTLYNIGSTPTSFFIDRHGIIRSTSVGPVNETALQQDVAQIS